MSWEKRRISELATIRPSKRGLKDRFTEDVLVSMVPMEFLSETSMSLNLGIEKRLSEVYSKYVYFENGDVVLAKITPCFENGKIGVAHGLKNGLGFGSSEFIPFRCDTVLVPEYLYHFMNRDSFRKEGARQMTGAVGHKRIPKEFYAEFEIPLPEIDEQKEIVLRLDALSGHRDEVVAKCKKELIDLEEIRQSILEQAFEGKLTQSPAS